MDDLGLPDYSLRKALKGLANLVENVRGYAKDRLLLWRAQLENSMLYKEIASSERTAAWRNGAQDLFNSVREGVFIRFLPLASSHAEFFSLSAIYSTVRGNYQKFVREVRRTIHDYWIRMDLLMTPILDTTVREIGLVLYKRTKKFLRRVPPLPTESVRGFVRSVQDLLKDFRTYIRDWKTAVMEVIAQGQAYRDTVFCYLEIGTLLFSFLLGLSILIRP